MLPFGVSIFSSSLSEDCCKKSSIFCDTSEKNTLLVEPFTHLLKLLVRKLNKGQFFHSHLFIRMKNKIHFHGTFQNHGMDPRRTSNTILYF